MDYFGKIYRKNNEKCEKCCMKFLIFGTGDYYNKYKKWFHKEDIIALIDNDSQKQGTLLDGHEIISPEEAVKRTFDMVFILSVHVASMRQQLINLGVKDDKILKFSDLHNYIKFLCSDQRVVFYGSEMDFGKIISGELSDAILLMSHNLDLNGASLALFYAAQILKEEGYNIIFVSWEDGLLRKHLEAAEIAVIIDPNLQIKTFRQVQWLQFFHNFFCNTINYYQLLSDRNMEEKVIWWLHDPVMFYESLDLPVLRSIKDKNLNIYAVGPIAESAFLEYMPQFEVKQLVYGIPDCKIVKKTHERLEFVTIGNVQDYKGQDILIAAIKLLPNEYRDKIHFRIIGSQVSAYATKIKEEALELGEMVTFLPFVEREKIHEVLDETDVLICPSRVDTMSIVVNEAMQHELPCIVSDSVGVAEYIEDNISGLVVKSDDPVMLAKKIGECINNKDKLKQMGKASRKVYEKCFSMPVFREKLLNTIGEVYV